MNERTTLEIIAPTVEEALEQGLAQLGLTADAVSVEVLDSGSKGLFGLGGRQVRVRLTVNPPPGMEEPAPAAPQPAPAPKAESKPKAREPKTARTKSAPPRKESGRKTCRPNPQNRRTQRPASQYNRRSSFKVNSPSRLASASFRAL
ncbi:MAG: Jag N-terminal domain-containing protein [Anaerolineales bacterium]|nr:Jag N-terminal domain-containing protein [Anaerolineales bacterium]